MIRISRPRRKAGIGIGRGDRIVQECAAAIDVIADHAVAVRGGRPAQVDPVGRNGTRRQPGGLGRRNRVHAGPLTDANRERRFVSGRIKRRDPIVIQCVRKQPDVEVRSKVADRGVNLHVTIAVDVVSDNAFIIRGGRPGDQDFIIRRAGGTQHRKRDVARNRRRGRIQAGRDIDRRIPLRFKAGEVKGRHHVEITGCLGQACIRKARRECRPDKHAIAVNPISGHIIFRRGRPRQRHRRGPDRCCLQIRGRRRRRSVPRRRTRGDDDVADSSVCSPAGIGQVGPHKDFGIPVAVDVTPAGQAVPEMVTRALPAEG